MVSALLRVACVLPVLIFFEACAIDAMPSLSIDEPGATETTVESMPSRGFRLHGSTATIVVVDGERTAFELVVERLGDVGVLHIAVEGLPTGVFAQSVTIPSTTDRALVEFTTSAPIAFGGPFAIHFRVTAQSSDASGSLRGTLVVAGRAGSFDESFSFDGVASIHPGGDVANLDAVRDCTIDSFGNVTMVGRSQLRNGRNEAFMARVRRDASMDPTFNGGAPLLGMPEFDASSSTNRAVATLDDGSFLLLGTMRTVQGSEAFVAARHADGSLDTTFGQRGIVGGISQDASSILLAGSSFAIHADTFSAFSYDGRPKTDFTHVTTSSSLGVTSASTIDRDSRVLVAGATKASISVARYRANGELDSEFGSRGIAEMSFLAPGTVFSVRSIRAMDTGELLVAVQQQNSDTHAAPVTNLLRVREDGVADASFGHLGLVALPEFVESVDDLALDSQGRILLMGTAHNEGALGSHYVARIHEDGTLDAAFGEDGVVRDVSLTSIRRVMVDPDTDRFYLCGETNDVATLARFWNP